MADEGLGVGSVWGKIGFTDDFSSGIDLFLLKSTRALDAVGNQFSKVGSSLTGDLDSAFESVTIVAGVAATAILTTVAAVTELGRHGSDVNDVADTMAHFSGSADLAELSLAALRQGTQGVVDNFSLMKDAAKLLAGGVSLTAEEFGTLGQAAFILQNRGLGSTKEMLDLVSQALLTGRTRALAMKIGVVDSADALLSYANNLGRLVSTLSETEKAEARRIAVMSLLNRAVADAGAQQRDFGEQLDYVRTQIRNWIDALAAQVAKSPQVLTALNAIGDALLKAFGGTSEVAIQKIVSWINRFADGVSTYFPKIVDALISVKDIIVGIYNAVQEAGDVVPDWLKRIAEDAGKATIAVYATAIAMSVLAGPTVISGLILFGKGIAIVSEGVVALVSGRAIGSLIELLPSLSDVFATVAASPFLVAGLWTALAAGIWQVIQAIRSFGDNWKAGGGTLWGFLTLKDDDTFVRRWLGWSSAIDKVTESIKRANAAKDIELKPDVPSAVATGRPQVGVIDDSEARLTQERIREAAERQKEYAKALTEYSSTAGAGYLSVLNQIGNAMYEGIVYDTQRGQSVSTLSKIYRVTESVIRSVIEAETIERQQLANTVKNIDDYRQAVDHAAAVVTKGFAGMPGVLQDMARGIHDATGYAEDFIGPVQQIEPSVRLASKSFSTMGTLVKSSVSEIDDVLNQMRNEAYADFGGMSDKMREAIHTAEGLGQSADEIARRFHISLSQVQTELYSVGNVFKDAFSTAAHNITQILMQAFTGGGGLLGAAKALGTQLASSIVTPMLAQLSRLQTAARVAQGPGTSRALTYGTTAVAVGSAAAGAAGGAFGGTAGAVIGSTAATIGGAAVGSAIAASSLGAISGAIALGAATAGIGLAAVGAYIALKHMFSLSPEYKAAKAAQATMVDQLLGMATAAERAEVPLTHLDKSGKQITNTYEVIATVARDAFLQAGYSADQTDVKIKALLDTKNPKAFADAMAELGKVIEFNTKKLADTATGVSELQSAFQSAGEYIPQAMRASLEALLRMNGLTDDQRKSIQAMVDASAPNYETLTKKAAEYGITLEALGPKFQQMDMDAAFKKIFNDFQMITEAGGDVGGVLLGMSDEIEALVLQTRKFGTAIPDNMRPLIDNLIHAGKLTDENGNLITDISQISFEETPLDKSLKNLNDTIDHLAEVLNRIPGLAAAAGNSVAGIPTPDQSDTTHNAGRGWHPPLTSVASVAPAYSTANSESSRATASSGPVTVQLVLNDGRLLAEVIASELPGALERAGIRF